MTWRALSIGPYSAVERAVGLALKLPIFLKGFAGRVR
jgi:hypothetical protein